MDARKTAQNRRQVVLGGAAALATAALPFREPGASSRLRIALIGDIPYSGYEEQRLLALWQSLADDVDVVIHVGDIKSGIESCSNELLERRIALLERCPRPLILVPGDNEWTDCNRALAGEFDPMERLAWLRRRVFAQSLWLGGPWPSGWPRPQRQSDVDPKGLPENLLWITGDTGLVTLNVPGSNYGLNSSGIADEALQRLMSANERWLRLAFDRAATQPLRALLIAIHADPGFQREQHASLIKRGRQTYASDDEDGYARFRRLLLDLSERWAGDVLLANGDSHRYRNDTLTARLSRVQSFGSPFNASWIRIERTPGGRQAFAIEVRQPSTSGAGG